MTHPISYFRHLGAVRLMKLSFFVSILSVSGTALLWMGGPKMVLDLGIELEAGYLVMGLLALAIIGALSMAMLGRKFPQ